MEKQHLITATCFLCSTIVHASVHRGGREGERERQRERGKGWERCVLTQTYTLQVDSDLIYVKEANQCPGLACPHTGNF